MFSDEERARYNRHFILPEVGEEGQEKLKNAKVLVIGAGGLGCPVLQYLTAAGVGTIGIIDFDNVDASNLQRQILFRTTDLGKNKAEIAASHLAELNPYVQFEVYSFRLENHNALQLFSQYDLVVDGTDNFSTRYLVNDACILTNTPLVYGAIFKFEGQVSVFNYQDGPSYRCLFPEPPEPGSVPNCSEIGVIGVLPGIIGTQQANEALKIILENGTVLSGKILTYNALQAQFFQLNVPRNEQQIQNVLDRRATFEQFDYDFFCGLTSLSDSGEASSQELKTWIEEGKTLQIVDVREAHEQPKIQQLNAINIPMHQLPEEMDRLDKNIPTVVFCQHGIRSLHAIEQMSEAGFTELINLTGGIVRWRG